MGFYEAFGEKYDRLVSLENRIERESPFFEQVFSRYGVETVLDCACGTGHHVVMFDRLGIAATGSDASATMIRLARENAREHGVDAAFHVTPFRKLTATFDRTFDAVVCVGNSLPHLRSDEELPTALGEMRALLDDDGVLLLEQRNYDRLLEREPRFFPMTIREDAVFFYVLDYLAETIAFNVVYVEPDTGGFDVFSTEYTPLRRERLERLVRSAGFDPVAFHGGYDGSDLDLAADDRYVVVCEAAPQ